MNIDVNIQKLDPLAVVPRYAYDGDAGFDFYSIDCREIHTGEIVLVNTGIAMEIPKGYEVQIRPRSGMSLKTHLRIANSPGTIDSTYRGEIGIIIENTGKKTLHVNVGDRIAQGVLNKVPVANFNLVDDLGNTKRGEDGYGSTDSRHSD